MKKKIIISSLIIGTIGICLALLLGPSLLSTEETLPPQQVVAPVQEPYSATLLAVGDNLIHDSIYLEAKKRGVNGGYDFTYPYHLIAPRLSKGDIRVINQESLITDITSPSSYPKFASPLSLADTLKNLGFNIVNLANNHLLDHGEAGLLNSLDRLKEKGLSTIGTFDTQSPSSSIVTQVVNNITFSFIGMTEFINGTSLPKNSPIQYVSAKDDALVEQLVNKAKEISDVVIVNVHWGEEDSSTPNPFQKELAQKLNALGVDVILGHHPHLLQPIEWMTSPSNHKTLIAYSLGNFISAQDKTPSMLGGLLDITFNKEPETGKIEITKAKMEGVVTHYEKAFKDIRVYPLTEYTPELALSHGLLEKDKEFTYDTIMNLFHSVIPPSFLS